MVRDACRPAGLSLSVEEAVYAVVRTGGKQYRVQEGRRIRVDRLAGEPGETIELGDVLLMGEGDDVTVGTPTVAGARVLGTIAEQGRAKKVIVFRYKPKTRSRKKTGHRQHFTTIVVDDILAAGQQPKPKKAPEPEPEAAEESPKGRGRGRRSKAEAEPAATAAPEAEPVTAATPEAPAEAEEPAIEAPAEASAEAPAEASAEPEAEKPKRGRKKAE